MKREFLREFFEKYIEGTPEKAIVADRKMFLCHLTKAVMKGIDIDSSIKSVYVTSRCVKHLYDKKPAEEFSFIINHLHKIVKYPDEIYKNLTGKRGDFCFVKMLKNEKYFCTIEIIKIPSSVCGVAELGAGELGVSSAREEIHIATAFRLRKEKYEKYIKNYTFLWDWGNGNPHRSALDTPKESTNAPQ